MLERTTQINLLYDFYAPLLTKKQQMYLELYYHEDHSLGEISELTEVSRQAVYDLIKRTENVLLNYEEKLRLSEKQQKRKEIYTELAKLCQNDFLDHTRQNQVQTYFDELSKLD